MAVVIVVIGYFILNYTKIGKFNKAIGSNVNAARLSGVPVNKYKFLCVSGYWNYDRPDIVRESGPFGRMQHKQDKVMRHRYF